MDGTPAQIYGKAENQKSGEIQREETMTEQSPPAGWYEKPCAQAEYISEVLNGIFINPAHLHIGSERFGITDKDSRLALAKHKIAKGIGDAILLDGSIYLDQIGTLGKWLVELGTWLSDEVQPEIVENLEKLYGK